MAHGALGFGQRIARRFAGRAGAQFQPHPDDLGHAHPCAKSLLPQVFVQRVREEDRRSLHTHIGIMTYVCNSCKS